MDSSVPEIITVEPRVEQILGEWGFTSLINVFAENQIDQESFLLLNENDIKELIPQLGIRKKFLVKHQAYVLSNKALDQQPIIDDTDTASDSNTNSISTVGSVLSNSTSEVEVDDLNELNVYPLKASLGAPYIITNFSTDRGETVRQLLDTTEEGTIIKKSYGPNSKFLRTNLCNLIIKNELKKTENKKISTERFIQLAKEINDIFIHEEASIYYLPYSKSNSGKILAARGKLWSTYVHQRQLYKKAGLLKNPTNEEPSTSRSALINDNAANQEEIEDALLWLKNNAEPFDQVVVNWKLTAQNRLVDFADKSIDQYYRSFPALGRQTGYILLESDFKHLYSEKDSIFFTKWSVFSKRIYELLKKKQDSYLKELLLKEGEALPEDKISVIALKYLPLLLQSPVIKAKVKHWKPSKQELINGFILWIDDIGDLDTAIQRRIDKCHLYQITAQPVPLFVGPPENITTYVSVNKVLYKLESPLKAVDLCFKIYHSLNASYPVEAEPSWMFIQKGIYGITTKLDKKFSSVETLIADCNITLRKDN